LGFSGKVADYFVRAFLGVFEFFLWGIVDCEL